MHYSLVSISYLTFVVKEKDFVVTVQSHNNELNIGKKKTSLE